MKKVILASLSLCVLMGGAHACPLQPAEGEKLHAFSNAGSMFGGIAAAQAVDAKYQAACQLWEQLVKCGADQGMATTLVINQQALMPLIAERLSKCSEGGRN
jgi:hypothetical protein